MMKSLKISVVIPAFNEEKLIHKCVEAVLNQTFSKEKYEVLVIDNNSSDKTAEIAKRFGATVIPYREKQGFTVAKQFGALQAKGEVIVFIDADSIPTKNWLETIDGLMQDGRLSCVGGTVLSTERGFINFLFVIYDFFARINQWFGISLVWGPNMAIRRESFMQVNGINTSLRTSDDWELTLRLQKKFGTRSTLYSGAVRVFTSPRKQRNLFAMINYCLIGVINYLSIFILRQSKTFGKPITIR